MGYDADVPYTILILQNVNDFADLLHSGHFPSAPEVSFKILPYIVATRGLLPKSHVQARIELLKCSVYHARPYF